MKISSVFSRGHAMLLSEETRKISPIRIPNRFGDLTDSKGGASKEVASGLQAKLSQIRKRGLSYDRAEQRTVAAFTQMLDLCQLPNGDGL